MLKELDRASGTLNAAQVERLISVLDACSKAILELTSLLRGTQQTPVVKPNQEADMLQEIYRRRERLLTPPPAKRADLAPIPVPDKPVEKTAAAIPDAISIRPHDNMAEVVNSAETVFKTVREHQSLPVADGTQTAMFVVRHNQTTVAAQALSVIQAQCPEKLAEPQPAEFNPSELIQARLEAHCRRLQKGQELRGRIVVNTKDIPSVRVLEARTFGFDYVVALGRLYDHGVNQLFLGYVRPSPTTVDKVLVYLKSVLDMWDRNLEFAMRGVDHGIATNKLATGEPIEDHKLSRVLQVERYSPKIHVIRPFTNNKEVVVVIA